MNTPKPEFRWIAFDVETTGLRAQTDRIVEIGALVFDTEGAILDSFHSLINPMCPMPPGARAVHRISDADLQHQPRASQVLPNFCDWLARHAGAEMLAHNAAFDAGFLGWELHRAGLPTPNRMLIDTVPVARRAWPTLTSHRLEFLATHFAWNLADPHRALGDCHRVLALWLAASKVLPRSAPPAARYPIRAKEHTTHLPSDFQWIEQAIPDHKTVRIEYDGGSRGTAPREITPLAFERRSGAWYLIALCHLDRIEKAFRLDRIRSAADPARHDQVALNLGRKATNV